ncbi:MAG: enoyl-CoA hydratase [Chloroflexi bacterium]|nr:MAG: enoyl-CoA hydratase [Chloroflexota bacterium]
MTYEYIITEKPAEGVGLIRLNRPKALNALSTPLLHEVGDALRAFDADDSVGAIVLTGDDRAFAAGADIKEMSNTSFSDMLMNGGLIEAFDFSKITKPIIAAVSGFVLGGGCEIAMMCDMIVASETAVFGQPEINLGIIPGGGGTQRLTRAVGKALAMEIILTDRRLSAQEALHYGLVNRVVAPEVYLQEAIKLAQKVASKSRVAVRIAKEAINKAYELSLREGLEHEVRGFKLLFGTEDRQEGMNAFVEKRQPQWKHR